MIYKAHKKYWVEHETVASRVGKQRVFNILQPSL